MAHMYERISGLCKERKISVSQMCRDLSITRSCLSELSKGRTESLSSSNTEKISKYFGVPTSYITSGDGGSDDELKFALFNGSDGITDEMFEEVKQFAEMVKLREEAKKSNERG